MHDETFTTHRRVRYYSSPVPFTSMPCSACGTQTTSPQWARVELGVYSGLCPECYTRLDEGFTAENAIAEAIIDAWIVSDAPVKPHRARQERTLRRVGAR
jgi:hypothetical protein